jgi:hypothetical protein
MFSQGQFHRWYHITVQSVENPEGMVVRNEHEEVYVRKGKTTIIGDNEREGLVVLVAQDHQPFLYSFRQNSTDELDARSLPTL